MDLQRLTYLLEKADRTPGENQELTTWYDSFEDEEGLTASLSPEQRDRLRQWLWNRISSAIGGRTTDTERTADAGRTTDTGAAPVLPLAAHTAQGRRLPWAVTAAAAACLVGVGLIYTFRSAPLPAPVHPPKGTAVADRVPGSDKAYLKLSDGSLITLDSAGTGVLATQAGVSIRKRADGQLVYQNAPGSDNIATFNTLSTPKGGQYRVTLPDGTLVWLNAETTLTYPTRFDDKSRRVELHGEAYFEVAGNPTLPFEVHTPGTDVMVLGTRFNVMAYPGEQRELTTLLSGAVAVSSATASGPAQRGQTLRPGQQAAVAGTGSEIAVTRADTAEAVAWKNGLFQFNDVALPVLLRQVARWYDVDIAYQGNPTEERFHGRISRQVNLSQLLKILELNGVQFTLTGRTLTVR